VAPNEVVGLRGDLSKLVTVGDLLLGPHLPVADVLVQLSTGNDRQGCVLEPIL
jgi:hypothetical protein